MRRRPEDIQKMRKAGRVVAEMHAVCREAARPGATTRHLDGLCRDVLAKRGARSNFLGYHGFPAVICASPNDVVVHGIPDDRLLVDGDVLSIDCGAIIDGWHGDAAFTMGIGTIPSEAEKLIQVTEEALFAGIAQMVEGNRIAHIGRAVQERAEGAGFAVVRDYVGHAIGLAMHEEPQVPNYAPFAGPNPKLRAGNVFAVEPMVVAGDIETFTMPDRWTVRTKDGSLAAHAEHTIAVTANGPEVLTLLD